MRQVGSRVALLAHRMHVKSGSGGEVIQCGEAMGLYTLLQPVVLSRAQPPSDANQIMEKSSVMRQEG